MTCLRFVYLIDFYWTYLTSTTSFNQFNFNSQFFNFHYSVTVGKTSSTPMVKLWYTKGGRRMSQTVVKVVWRVCPGWLMSTPGWTRTVPCSTPMSVSLGLDLEVRLSYLERSDFGPISCRKSVLKTDLKKSEILSI